MNKSESVISKIEAMLSRLNLVGEARILSKATKILAKLAIPATVLNDKEKRNMANGFFSITDDFLQFAKLHIKKRYKKANKEKLDLNAIAKDTHAEFSKTIYPKGSFNSKSALWFELYNSATLKGNPVYKEVDLWREVKKAIDSVFDSPTFMNNANRLGINLPRFF